MRKDDDVDADRRGSIVTVLTDDERRALHASVDRVRRLAADKLRAIDDASRAIAFVTNLHAGIDRVAATAAAAGPTPDCRAGCAHCCRVRVEATEPEVFLIARWLRRQPQRDLDAFVDRLRRAASERADDPTRRSDCAFLVDARCVAYDVRPATCRTAHSLSVRACENRASEIPQDLKVIVDAEALMAGTSQAYREVGLAATARELNAAVLAAMRDASSERRWYASRGDAPRAEPSNGSPS